MVNLLPPRFIDPASADAINDTLRYNPSTSRVEFMPGGGGSGGTLSGAVARYALGTSTTISTASNVDLPDITGNLVSTASTDVFLVDVTLDLDGSSSPGSLVAELVVDSTAQANQIVVRRGSSGRHPARQLYRVTGLSAGSHPFKVRARLDVAGGSYVVNTTHTVVTVTHLTGGTSGAVVSSLDDLTDVDVTTTPPALGDGLVWDGTNYVPGASSGGTSGNIDGGAPNTIYSDFIDGGTP